MHMMQPVEAPAQTPHNPFDVCDCQDCLDEAYKLEYEEEDNQRKKKGSQFTLKQRYEAGDPTVGLLGEPSGKFDYYVLYGDSKPKPKPPKPSPPPPLKHPPTPPKECFTLTPAPSPQNYHTEFPPLSTFENVQQKARHSWKIENPTTIGANGVQHQVTPAEATLNWQSENAVAQNNALRSIIAKQEDLLKSQAALSNRMTGLEGIIYEIKNKILGIHNELLQMAYNNPGMQKARHSWKIENPTTIGANGVQHQVTPAEATLNWQSENAVAQNNALRSIIAKQEDLLKSQAALSNRMTGLEGIIYEIRSKILGLHNELLQMAYNNPGMRPSTSKPQDPSTGKKVADDSMMMASSKAPEDVPIKSYDPVASFLSALRRKDYVEQPLILTDSDDESASDDTEIDAPKPYKKDTKMLQYSHNNCHILPAIYTMSKVDTSSSSSLPLGQEFMEKEIPEEVIEVIADQALKDRSLICYKTFLTITLRQHGLFMKGLIFHPDYPL
ncbi:hypothetical protein QVD17_34997 [Tagetes erecta]|uniref:Uncharacterized protein n=1 Tax=Tagetes erecta TaxID=13708 RepID=A0AAD8K1A1_TARER|nr:hypothetical protein QVD17_34997 [Tagetes erecta]